jgi:hypothetical protein
MRLEGFIGPTYQASSLNADAERSMNLYAEAIESVGKNKTVLRGTPGLSLWGTLPTAPVRGMLAAGGPLSVGPRLFAVGGSKLYEVFVDGTSTLRGDVGDGGAHYPVQMFPNGNQLYIVSDGKAYVDNGAGPALATFVPLTGTVTTTTSGSNAVVWVSGDVFESSMLGNPIVINGSTYTVATYTDSHHLTLASDPGNHVGAAMTYTGPVTATTGAFLDGYFIAQASNSKQFNISAQLNGLSWNGLDFGIKEGYPDNIGAILADHEELWLLGEETTEVWRNTGAAAFPFERDPSGFIQQGIAAPWSAVRLANSVAWIGGDTRGQPVAWLAQGFQPKRISTHAVEKAWAAYSTVADAIAYCYLDEGHQFWVISFPLADATWVYDATTGLWHERGWWNGTGFGRQRGQCHAFCFGLHLVGDWENGKIYRMSSSLYDDAGTAIHRIRAAPHLANEDKRLMYSRFRLDAENTGALNPSLDWSNDGGHSFINSRTTVSNTAGALSVYDWRRLGKARDRVFQITITAAVKVALIDAYLEFSAGLS